MGSDWVSQSRACAIYGLTAADLQDNVFTVIDKCSNEKHGSERDAGVPVRVNKFPRVPLTLLLVKNPRGYRLPMRLYKVTELEKLSALKRAEAPPPKEAKKPVKKAKTNRKRARKADAPADPPCLTRGHNIESGPVGTPRCVTCGQQIEIEEI